MKAAGRFLSPSANHGTSVVTTASSAMRSPAERGCYGVDGPVWRPWLPGVHLDQRRAQAERDDCRGLAEDRGADHVAVDRVPSGAEPASHPAGGQLRVAVAEHLQSPGELTERPVAPGATPPALGYHLREARAQPEDDLRHSVADAI